MQFLSISGIHTPQWRSTSYSFSIENKKIHNEKLMNEKHYSNLKQLEKDALSPLGARDSKLKVKVFQTVISVIWTYYVPPGWETECPCALQSKSFIVKTCGLDLGHLLPFSSRSSTVPKSLLVSNKKLCNQKIR